MIERDTLVTPFESWREGLLNLADALDSAERTEIMVARLDATAQTTEITIDDICALAQVWEISRQLIPLDLRSYSQVSFV
jgi:hypothetical protein